MGIEGSTLLGTIVAVEKVDGRRLEAGELVIRDISISLIAYLGHQEGQGKSTMSPSDLPESSADGLGIPVNLTSLSNCERLRTKLDSHPRVEGDCPRNVEGKEDSGKLGLGGQAKKLALKRMIDLGNPEGCALKFSIRDLDWPSLCLMCMVPMKENKNFEPTFSQPEWGGTGRGWPPTDAKITFRSILKLASVTQNLGLLIRTSTCVQFSLSLRRIKEKAVAWAGERFRDRDGLLKEVELRLEEIYKGSPEGIFSLEEKTCVTEFRENQNTIWELDGRGGIKVREFKDLEALGVRLGVDAIMGCGQNIFLLEALVLQLQLLRRCTLDKIASPLDTTPWRQGWLTANSLGLGVEGFGTILRDPRSVEERDIG
eukprot:Gb_12492 [translate_table: standard]